MVIAHRYFPAIASLVAFSATACAGCGDKNEAVGPAAPSAGAIAETDHIKSGREQFSAGDYEGAVEAFSAALADERRHDPKRADSVAAQVFFQRGEAYLALGFPDTAIEDFTDVIRLAPNDGPAFDRRAAAHLQLGDQYKAIRDATTAIRLDPDAAAAYRTRGIAYVDGGQYDRAVADLNQAIDVDATLADELRPVVAQAYLQWSRRLDDDGAEVLAAEKLALARQLDPSIPTAPADVVVVEVDPVDEPVEVTVAKPVIDDEAVERYEAGVQRVKEGRRDEALMAFTEAIAQDGDYADAYVARGKTLLSMGFPDSALEDFTTAIRRGRASAEAHRLEARAFLELKRPYRATVAATDALQFDPSDAEAYAIRGEAHLSMTSWDRAIVDLEEAVRREEALAERLRPLIEEARAGLAEQRRRETAAVAGEPAAAVEAEAVTQ
jgi:tetratricopeptide (TPR) repeat protein